MGPSMARSPIRRHSPIVVSGDEQPIPVDAGRGQRGPIDLPAPSPVLRRPGGQHQRVPVGRPVGSRGSKYFVFTWNNPSLTPEEVQTFFARHNPTYLAFQKEIGEQGTPHYQGYIELPKQTRFNQLHQGVPDGETIWFAQRRGTAQQASDYATKADSRAASADAGPHVFGELSRSARGKRTDLLEFRDAILSGSTARTLVQEYPKEFARYGRFYDRLSALCEPALLPGDRPVQVILLHGDTGVGKSRHVYDKHWRSGELYVIPVDNSGFWVDGYDGHAYALLDDFAGAASKLTLAALLRILDRYPTRVPVKGGFVWWKPRKIYITTNVHPKLWYDYSSREEQYNALFRRFSKVKSDNITLEGTALRVFKNREAPPPVFSQWDHRNAIYHPAL